MKYARRVFGFRMFAVKNSQNRLPDFSDRKKSVGALPAGVPTAANWRPEIIDGLFKLWSGLVTELVYDNVLYHRLLMTGVNVSSPFVTFRIMWRRIVGAP